MFWQKTKRAIRPAKVEVLPKGYPWVTVQKKNYGEALFSLGFAIWMLPLIGSIVAFGYGLVTGQTSFLDSVPIQVGITLFMIWLYITMAGTAIFLVGVIGWFLFGSIRFLITGKSIC